MPGLGFILERKAQNRKGRIFDRTLDLVPSTVWAALTGAAGVVHASWGQHLPLASWFPQQWPQQMASGGEKGGRGLDPRSAPWWAACGARLSASTLQPALWSHGSEGRIWPTRSAGKKKKASEKPKRSYNCFFSYLEICCFPCLPLIVREVIVKSSATAAL